MLVEGVIREARRGDDLAHAQLELSALAHEPEARGDEATDLLGVGGAARLERAVDRTKAEGAVG